MTLEPQPQIVDREEAMAEEPEQKREPGLKPHQEEQQTAAVAALREFLRVCGEASTRNHCKGMMIEQDTLRNSLFEQESTLEGQKEMMQMKEAMGEEEEVQDAIEQEFYRKCHVQNGQEQTNVRCLPVGGAWERLGGQKMCSRMAERGSEQLRCEREKEEEEGWVLDDGFQRILPQNALRQQHAAILQILADEAWAEHKKTVGQGARVGQGVEAGVMQAKERAEKGGEMEREAQKASMDTPRRGLHVGGSKEDGGMAAETDLVEILGREVSDETKGGDREERGGEQGGGRDGVRMQEETGAEDIVTDTDWDSLTRTPRVDDRVHDLLVPFVWIQRRGGMREWK